MAREVPAGVVNRCFANMLKYFTILLLLVCVDVLLERFWEALLERGWGSNDKEEFFWKLGIALSLPAGYHNLGGGD